MDRLKDEPRAFEPLPGTYCHCPRWRRVISATITESMRMATTTCHGQVSRSVTAQMEEG